jgi:hypothetical protein
MASVPGKASDAEQHVKQLIEHWQWKHYWYGTTELGSMYQADREFQAFLFWRANEIPGSVGFCSTDLGVCQFYPDTKNSVVSSEMKVASGDNLQSAFRHFLRTSFNQNALARMIEPELKEADYVAEAVKIYLPPLEAPEAIRERRVRPIAETNALLDTLACLKDQPGCSAHLLIPFYSDSDIYVPVYRECKRCPYPGPKVIFMRLVEGKWWHGARDFDDSPDSVNRTRRQIEKALMIEANR